MKPCGRGGKIQLKRMLAMDGLYGHGFVILQKSIPCWIDIENTSLGLNIPHSLIFDPCSAVRACTFESSY